VTDGASHSQEQGVTVDSLPERLPTPARPELRAVYREHFTHVWLTLRRLGGAERDIEVAAHEVFLVVHRRLADYDPRRPLRPWLTGIAYRVAADERRRARHRREEPVGAREPADRAPGPEEQAATHQEQELVRQALAALPPERRVVFVMHELDGCTMPEVAEALAVPLNTCYSRLRLGREQFVAALTRLRPSRRER